MGTVNCDFCGKELKTSLFKGELKVLSIGKGSLSCCQECYDKYKDGEVTRENRFYTKLENYKKANKIKSISSKDIANMYKAYVDEETQQIIKLGGEIPNKAAGCFILSQNGAFSVREFSTKYSNEDVSAKAMLKSLNKAQSNTECCFFSKDDITKIEYAKSGMGAFIGLFSQAYSFNIRLNDEKVMTYKPCITRTAQVGRGFGLGYQKSAEKRLVDQLNMLKKAIGSDLPIVKVKKI